MKSNHIIHLAPSDQARTGIASYADVLDQALKRYAPSFTLLRVEETMFLKSLHQFPKGAFIWAEIGVNEGAIFRALAIQKKIRPDLKRFITIHDSPRFTHSPIKVLEHFDKSIVLRGIRRFVNLIGEGFFLKHFLQPNDHFICLSPIGSKALQKHLSNAGLPYYPVLTLPHLLYLEFPSPFNSITQSLHIDLGFFGFISKAKGLDILIDSAILLSKRSDIDSVPFISICGKAAKGEETYLIKQIEKTQRAGLTKKIHFGSFLERNELPRFLQQLRFLALPYNSPPVISASGVLQWARTYGIPVIASSTPALTSLINDGIDGYLIPEGNIERWADTLLKISTYKLSRENLSIGITERQTEASWKSVVGQVVNIIEQAG